MTEVIAIADPGQFQIVGHVKWFHDFSFSDIPQGFADALSPLVISLVFLSALAVGSLVIVDRMLARSAVYGEVTDWLKARQQHALLAMRIGAGMTLLLSWQANALLVPELPIQDAWVGWMQFVLALLLIFPKTTPLAGIGLSVLWIIGVVNFGLFHMLDYVLFIGVATYLGTSLATDRRIKGLGIPALYSGLGFSLIWVALEKIVYPQWGEGILEDMQYLTLGFETDTFLILVAFVELALGFLLVIGLLGRPLGVVITLVLFTTALFFGKTEVVGHTIIHASLIVFLLEGDGNFYRAPIRIHRQIPMRFAFATVNFLVVSAVLFSAYVWIAQAVFEDATS